MDWKVAACAGEHLGAVEDERLRAQEGRARRVEDVVAHIIAVRPDAQVRIVEEVAAEMEAVAVIGAGGVAGGGDGDTLVGDGAARRRTG